MCQIRLALALNQHNKTNNANNNIIHTEEIVETTYWADRTLKQIIQLKIQQTFFQTLYNLVGYR